VSDPDRAESGRSDLRVVHRLAGGLGFAPRLSPVEAAPARLEQQFSLCTGRFDFGDAAGLD